MPGPTDNTEHARRAAADVMRRPEQALTVHAEQLGVDPSSSSPARATASSLVSTCSAPCCRCCRGSGRHPDSPTVLSIVIGVVAAAAVGALIGHLAERSIARSILRPSSSSCSAPAP